MHYFAYRHFTNAKGCFFSATAAFLFLTFPLSCIAETIFSLQSGNWSEPSTWSADRVPQNGDVVVIRDHVQIDTHAVVGESSDSDATGLSVESPGSLTILSGFQLTLRGSAKLDNAPLTMKPGSILEFDSSLAISPSSSAYSLQIGAANNQPQARLIIQGTADMRCKIQSQKTNGGANGFITDDGFLQGGLITGSYVDFESVGDSSRSAIQIAATGDAFFQLENAIFKNCGALRSTYHLGENVIFSLKNITWRQTLGPLSAEINSYNELVSGLREISNCVFDKEVRFYPPTGLLISENIFGAGFDVLDGNWAGFKNNLVRHEGTARRIASSVSNNYWLIDNSQKVNPHFLQAGTYSRDITVDGEIFDFRGANGDGDCILIGEPQEPVKVTVKNCIVLPNSASDNSGTLFSALGNNNIEIVAEHNTYFTGSQGAACGETYEGKHGMISSFRSNLAWDSVGGRGYKLFDSGINNNVVDLVSSEMADFNLGFNLRLGSNLRGYDNLEFSNGSPGEHDLELNPLFRDPTRNISSWDESLGGPGSAEHAYSEIIKINDLTGYNGAYTVAALYRYVREGFSPANILLKNAAHDGTDIGAVPVSLVETPGPQISPTNTPTPTVQPISTNTFTATPTATVTVIPSNTPSPTLTATPTITGTPTPTRTAIFVPATASPTRTVTATPTRTKQPTKTPRSVRTSEKP